MSDSQTAHRGRTLGDVLTDVLNGISVSLVIAGLIGAAMLVIGLFVRPLGTVHWMLDVDVARSAPGDPLSALRLMIAGLVPWVMPVLGSLLVLVQLLRLWGRVEDARRAQDRE